MTTSATLLPRRRLLAAAGTAATAILAAPATVRAQNRSGPRLVVIGGGFGGASAARFAEMTYRDVQVTLVEPLRRFVAHSYDGLRNRGVRIVHGWAEGIDPVRRTVRLRGGTTLTYDRPILSPGIAIRWGALEGYDEAAAQRMPHAWVPADGAQTALLRRQLEAMPDGGGVGFAIPDNPFRCPPGPYERISMVAHYLKRHKPRSKILALDAKNAFSKQPLFQDGWRALYGEMIEWVPGNRDGKVMRVDPARMVLETEFGMKHTVAVANVIPPQSAARIASEPGLTDASGWVPVNPRTFESRTAPGIHVVGDANIGTPMPKSGYIANSTTKQAVARAVAALRNQPPPEPVYYNTCYSHVGENYGISVVNIYRPTETAIVEVPNSGGVSPRGDLPDQRRQEARAADAWYASITRDMFS